VAEIDFPASPVVGQEYQFATNTWVWTGYSWDLKSATPGFVDPSNIAYTHIQGVASDTWVITHNLGYAPGGISVMDSAGTMVEGDVTHNTLTSLTIEFTSGFSGTAYLS
jgi:hypothetical protein